LAKARLGRDSIEFSGHRYYYSIVLTLVRENSGAILRRIALAAERSGRSPSEIELIAVTKTVDTNAIREAVEAGLRTFGESRVQEVQDKVRELEGMGIKWHMIGHLQKNKAKAAVGIFEMIHSIDSVGLMEALHRHAGDMGKAQRMLIQVKLVPEDVSKHGIEESGLGEFLKRAKGFDNLKIEGLMTIPPFYDDPERARPLYRRLKALAGEYGLKELSMGMTGDFEIAVEEGATMVRVGSAIFGERQ
jgi:pyridoxal phosphate enzyme (YggS family)